MQFIANGLNGFFLRNILPPPEVEIDGVIAAIAYGSNFNDKKYDFIGHCLANRYRLDIWMRYDHTIPVAVSLLKRLLCHHKDNIFCNLVPDCLHSKVIWWKGYGAYIGSANLTDRAWVSNIEAGVFLSESDLQNDNIQIELENFFDGLRSASQIFPLTEEIIRELEKIDKERHGVDERGEAHRTVPVWGGPLFFEAKRSKDSKKEAFRIEWQETLTHLRSIGDRLVTNRPSWITDEVPVAWQIDQFLHAYYYNKVGDSLKKPYEDYFTKNKANPNQALGHILNWWKETTSAPSNEDETFYRNAPLIRRYLAKESVLSLTEQQLSEICEKTHAT
jgi:PLD-like domain